ncbi:MAG: sulfite exporter TauE/SafE family protein [Candidatus Omnitrophica bacterium]|nr:sulfite exporter TauE/SafE family protein [Candidatus Omnitrophota bacterium]
MTQLIAEGWALGLSTGPYCFGACVPFVVPYLFAEGLGTWRANIRVIGEFLLGRLLAYATFGMFVGWLGQSMQPHLSERVTSWALLGTALIMIIYAFNQSLPRLKFCEKFLSGKKLARMPLILGILIGINVCPPFVVGVARLLQVGGISAGLVFFLGFFVGTSLYVIPLIGLSPFTQMERLRSIGTWSALLVGTYFLVSSISALF